MPVAALHVKQRVGSVVVARSALHRGRHGAIVATGTGVPVGIRFGGVGVVPGGAGVGRGVGERRQRLWCRRWGLTQQGNERRFRV